MKLFIFVLLLLLGATQQAQAQTYSPQLDNSLNQWNKYVVIGANPTNDTFSNAGVTYRLDSGQNGTVANVGILAPTVGQAGPIRLDLSPITAGNLGKVVTTGWTWGSSWVWTVISVVLGMAAALIMASRWIQQWGAD